MSLVPWQATVTNETKSLVPNPVVTVRNRSDATLATIYSDAVGTPLVNPITGDDDGYVKFWAQPGEYTIDGAKSGDVSETWDWDAVDLDVTQPYATRATAIAALSGLSASITRVGWYNADRSTSWIVRKTGATDIADAAGWIPDGELVPEHFGADTGAANNYTALTAAIAYGRTSGRTLDGGWKNYALTTALTELPGTVRRLKIDASGLTATAAWQTIGGVYEAPQTLTGDTRQNERMFTLTAHGYSVGDVVLITSGLVFETATSTKCAHWGKIQAVTANTFTTYEATLCNLLTSNNAIVRRLPDGGRVDVEVEITGGANCTRGFWPVRCIEPVMRGKGYDFLDRAFSPAECYRPRLTDIYAETSGTVVLGYGVSVAGCGWPLIDKVSSLRCRHTLTFGPTNTIPVLGPSFGDVIASQGLAGPLDVHPGVIAANQFGRTICDVSNELAAEDGFVFQGVGGSAEVIFRGGAPTRHGFLFQPSHVDAAFDIPPSWNFRIIGVNALDRAVSLALAASGAIESITIHVEGRGVVGGIYAVPPANVIIKHLALSGDVVSTAGRAMHIISNTAADLRLVTLTGRWLAGANESLYFQCGSTQPNRTKALLSNVHSSGGTYGIRALNNVDVIVGPSYLAGSSAPTLAGGGATVTVLT